MDSYDLFRGVNICGDGGERAAAGGAHVKGAGIDLARRAGCHSGAVDCSARGWYKH